MPRVDADANERMALRSATVTLSRAGRSVSFKVPSKSLSTNGFAMPKLPQPSENVKFLAGIAAKLAGAGLAGSFLAQPFFG